MAVTLVNTVIGEVRYQLNDEHAQTYHDLKQDGKTDVASAYAVKYGKAIGESRSVQAQPNNEIQTTMEERTNMTRQDVQNRAIDTSIISNQQPVDPRLNLPKLLIGLLPLINVLDPVKATQFFSNYSVGNPSLSAFDGQTPIAQSDLSIKGVNLTSSTYATIIEASNEVMNDSAIDIDQYFAGLHELLVGQAHEQGAINAVLNGNTDLVQKVVCATSGTVAVADIQSVFNTLSSPVRKNSVFIVADDQEIKLQTLTMAGLPLLKYDADAEGLDQVTMMGRPVLFSPQMKGTNNALMLVDPSVLEVVPFSNGDELFKSTEFVGDLDLTAYRILARHSATVKRTGSATVLALN